MLRRTSSRPLATLLAVLALLLAACGGGGDDDQAAPPAEDGRTITTVAESTTTTRPAYRSLVATPLTEGELVVVGEPNGTAPVATLQHPRYINDDPNAAVPLVLLVKQEVDGWLELYLPIRPNGSTGWVPASSVSLAEHDFRIEVTLDEFHLRVLDADEVVFEADIGVARDNAPTPEGVFYTTELLVPPEGPGGPYGAYAFGMSGYSDTYQTFNGGPGQLGIHGTNQPEAIGTQVSAGCIRLRNEDITTMAEDLGLPLGVPVVVQRTSAGA